MKTTTLRKIENLDFDLTRRVTDVTFAPTVLSTEFVPISRFDQFRQKMADVAKEHSNPFYIHYEFRTDDVVEAVRRVPKCLHAINRSRVLRRARISGLRMCNLVNRGPNVNYYVSDMVVSSLYDAAVICSGLLTFHKAAYADIEFKVDDVRQKRFRLIKQEQMFNDFWRRSCLSRHALHIEFLEPDPLFGSLRWRISSKKLELMDAVYKVLEYLGSEISSVSMADERIIISRNSNAEAENYSANDFQRTYPVRYRHYSAFGIYCNNPRFLLY